MEALYDADELDDYIDDHAAEFAAYSPDGEQRLEWTSIHNKYVARRRADHPRRLRSARRRAACVLAAGRGARVPEVTSARLRLPRAAARALGDYAELKLRRDARRPRPQDLGPRLDTQTGGKRQDFHAALVKGAFPARLQVWLSGRAEWRRAALNKLAVRQLPSAFALALEAPAPEERSSRRSLADRADAEKITSSPRRMARAARSVWQPSASPSPRRRRGRVHGARRRAHEWLARWMSRRGRRVSRRRRRRVGDRKRARGDADRPLSSVSISSTASRRAPTTDPWQRGGLCWLARRRHAQICGGRQRASVDRRRRCLPRRRCDAPRGRADSGGGLDDLMREAARSPQGDGGWPVAAQPRANATSTSRRRPTTSSPK